MLAPGSTHLELAQLWQRLMSSAALQRGLEDAMVGIARFLRASEARLLDLAPDAAAATGDEVHAFDRRNGHPALLQALDASRADHGLCAVLRPGEHRANAVAVMRSDTPFGEAERSWLQLLVPQLRLALDIAGNVNAQWLTTQAAGTVTRLLPTPCLLTDEAGRCIERNAAFDKALAALRGSIRAGRIVFDDPFLESSWRQALTEGQATAEAQSLLASAAGGPSWKVHVVPVPCVRSLVDATPRRLMLALFERVAGVATQTHMLQSSRPLTKAELEVLASLLLGHTAKVIARARGASVHTVRSQITSILGKTGHHTQKELIASLGSSSFDGVLADGDGES